MIPYWNETLTIFHRNIAEDGRVSWASNVITRCFWQRKSIRERTGGAEFSLERYVCRIPGHGIDLNIGDIVVCGKASVSIDEYDDGHRSVDLMRMYSGKCMTVSAVHYNTGPVTSMNHVYAEGS